MENAIELTTVAEYSATAAGLAELRKRYADAKYDVATTKGMTEAKEARAEIRTLRVNLEKMRVEIKAPALKRCQDIDGEAKRITKELTALEDPIDSQIKAEEKRKADEKAERDRVEALRVAGIKGAIEMIRAQNVGITGLAASGLQAIIERLAGIQVSEEEFAEFFQEAAEAKDAALTQLQITLVARQAQDAEAARLKAEADRLAAERKQQEEAAAAEAKRLADERAAFEAERAEFQRQQREAAEAALKAQEAAVPVVVSYDVAVAGADKAVEFIVEQNERVEGFSPHGYMTALAKELVDEDNRRVVEALANEPTVYSGLQSDGMAALADALFADEIADDAAEDDEVETMSGIAIVLTANQLRAALAIAEAMGSNVELTEAFDEHGKFVGIFASAVDAPEEGSILLPA